MTRPLTSWKEIAAYLGKGVRTVQRWSAERGFPVRRPGRNIIVAIPSEIDAWVRRDLCLTDEGAPDPVAELAQAKIEIQRLRKEVDELRVRLNT